MLFSLFPYSSRAQYCTTRDVHTYGTASVVKWNMEKKATRSDREADAIQERRPAAALDILTVSTVLTHLTIYSRVLRETQIVPLMNSVPCPGIWTHEDWTRLH